MAGSRQSLRVVPGARSTFSNRLRQQRVADDLTQEQLGARFRVRQQTIGAWERGERPQSRFFDQLAEYLDLPDAKALLGLIEEEPPPGGVGIGLDDPESQADAQAMRDLADTFAQIQRTRSLTREETDIYRGLIDYFRVRLGE